MRRIASMSCINLHKHSPQACFRSGLIDLLYDGIRDSDPIAIVNCLLALQEVLKEEGGLVINKGIAHHLLGRLVQFSECDAIYVINLLMKYEPKKEEEIFDMLNELDFCLKSTSPSLLITSIRYFFHLTKAYTHLTVDLCEVVTNPLCKILSQNRPELCYFILIFVQSLSDDFKKNFCAHFKYFLVKAKDPDYLKEKKFEVLPKLASKENFSEILSEVKHYTANFQSYKSAFRCIASLGCLDADAKQDVFTLLSHVIKNSNDQIVEAALECTLTVVYKNDSEDLAVADLPKPLCSSVSLALGRSSLQELNPELVLRTFQIFVPFLENVQDFLEDFSKQVDSFNPDVRCLFLSSTCLAFLHWPPLVQPILVTVLREALKCPFEEVVSHAAFIYALLEEGPQKASQLLSISKFVPRFDMLEKVT